MMLKRLAQVVAVGALLSIAGQLLAQSTSMETRQGSRHAGPGAVDPSASTFAVGITLDNGATFVNSAAVSDTVEIRGEVRPEPANVGLPADIFVVDRVIDGNGAHISFSMRSSAGVWLPWNGTVSLLVPFLEDVPLQANHPFTMFSGTLGTEGDHRIFLGYMAPDGILRYHTSGLPVTITAAPSQNPLVEAQAYYEASIHTGVVPFCLECHVQGGAASGQSLHTFVFGSSQAAIDTNFSQFQTLFNARGKAYILAKARGELTHVGGVVLPASSSQYQNLETFLDLLAEI